MLICVTTEIVNVVSEYAISTQRRFPRHKLHLGTAAAVGVPYISA